MAVAAAANRRQPCFHPYHTPSLYIILPVYCNLFACVINGDMLRGDGLFCLRIKADDSVTLSA